MPLCTDCAVESEKHVSRTNQPVLMHRVELNTGTILQDLWPTDQRNIVVVNDVKPLLQNLLNALRVEQR